MALNNTSTFTLRSILEKEKLNGTNFLDCSRNLRIVLKQERKMYVLDNEIPNEPPANNAPRAERDAYSKHLNNSVDVTYLMLTTMNSELQKQFEEIEAFDMMVHLKGMFQEQARQERFTTTKALNTCKMTLGTSVSAHVLKMKGLIDQLDKLGALISHELATDLILGSLPESYDQFVMNYNMHNMEKSIVELHGMLKNVETNIQKTNPVLMVQKGEGMKRKGKAKAIRPRKAKDSPSLRPRSQSHPRREFASSVMNKVIGRGVVSSTWKI